MMRLQRLCLWAREIFKVCSKCQWCKWSTWRLNYIFNLYTDNRNKWECYLCEYIICVFLWSVLDYSAFLTPVLECSSACMLRPTLYQSWLQLQLHNLKTVHKYSHQNTTNKSYRAGLQTLKCFMLCVHFLKFVLNKNAENYENWKKCWIIHVGVSLTLIDLKL